MLDHCGECGTDFAFGLPLCPNCQVPNARLTDTAAAEGEDTPATPAPPATLAETPVKDEVPTPRRPAPTGKKPDLPDDAPKIHPN